MLNNHIGIITAFESRDLLKSLTSQRGVSTVPIAGKYKAIDFPLSNLINCGIKNISILAEKNCRSLRTHVEMGKSWGLSKKSGGLFINSSDALCDTQLLNENIEYLYQQQGEIVVIAPTYMIANVDLKSATEFHEKSGNDITVIYKKIENTTPFYKCDVLEFNELNSLVRAKENSGNKKNQNISLEIFILRKDLLISLIQPHENCSIPLKNVIYKSKLNLKIGGFEHKEYLSCLNSLANYFKINMDMIDSSILKEVFFNENRPIYSKIKDSIPTHYHKGSTVKNSIVSNECSIKGSVINSILSRYVVIEEGATVENSIILQNCTIKSGSRIKNLIIDKNVSVENGTQIEGSPFYPIVIQKKFSL